MQLTLFAGSGLVVPRLAHAACLPPPTAPHLPRLPVDVFMDSVACLPTVYCCHVLQVRRAGFPGMTVCHYLFTLPFVMTASS